MREWVELFDEPRPYSLFGYLKYHLSVYRVVDFVPAGKSLCQLVKNLWYTVCTSSSVYKKLTSSN